MGQCISGGSATRRARSAESFLETPSIEKCPPTDSSVQGTEFSSTSQPTEYNKIRNSTRTSFTSAVSSNDMKQAKQFKEHIAHKSSIVSQLSHRVSPSKKCNRAASKNVSFIEPEIERDVKEVSRKIKTFTFIKPLTVFNFRDQIKQKNRGKGLTFSAPNHPSSKFELYNASSLEFPDSTRTESLISTKNSDGLDSTTIISSPQSRSAAPTTDAETMGITSIKDNDADSAHQSVKGLQKPLNSADICGSRGQNSIITSSLIDSSIAPRPNLGTNHSSGIPVHPSCVVKNSDIIREEIRLRRSLFFGNSDRGSENLTKSSSPQGGEILQMKSQLKPSNFGLRQSTDNRPFSSPSRTTSETSPLRPSPAGGGKLTEMNLPKLYSVHNIQYQTGTSGSRASPFTSQAERSNPSKLPTLSSGGFARGTGNSAVPIRTTNLHPRACYPGTTIQPLRQGKPVEPNVNSSPNQWTYRAESFKQRSASDNSRICEIKVAAVSSQIGSGCSSVAPMSGTCARKGSPQAQRHSSIPRGSVYSNLGSKLPTCNNSGVKKPLESVPFYMMNLYSNRGKYSPGQEKSVESKNQTPSTTGFSAVSTGVVKQRTMQYQTKIGERSNIPLSAPAPLVRSATYVKSSNQLAPKCNTPVEDPVRRISSSPKCARYEDNKREETHNVKKSSPISGIPSSRTFRISSSSSYRDNKENCQNVSPEGVRRSFDKTRVVPLSFHPPAQEDVIAANFPLARDGSTSSSIISTVSSEEHSNCGSGYATGEADKVISDSEFLIDDEISDQPELTLTFKDSSLVLSASSSGESLASCDLMLDYRESSCGHQLPGNLVLLDDGTDVGLSNNRGIELSVTESIHSDALHTSSLDLQPLGISEGLKVHIKSGAEKLPFGENETFYSRDSSTETQPSGHLVSGPTDFVPSHFPVLSARSDKLDLYRNTTSNASKPKFLQNQNPGQFKSESVHSNIHLSPKSLKHRRNEVASRRLTKDTQEIEQYDAFSELFIKEIVMEVTECKNKLSELLGALETNEKEMSRKDEVIHKQQQEVDFWKFRYMETVNKMADVPTENNTSSLAYEGGDWPKEKFQKHLVNSAAQTESNYTSRAAVTYPEEHDKMGQLVSFRIGRRTPASNESH